MCDVGKVVLEVFHCLKACKHAIASLNTIKYFQFLFLKKGMCNPIFKNLGGRNQQHMFTDMYVLISTNYRKTNVEPSDILHT